MRVQVVSFNGVESIGEDSKPTSAQILGLPWLAFPVDAGQCAGQEVRIEVEAPMGITNCRARVSAQFGESTSTYAFGVACFLALLHRHTGQSAMAISLQGHSSNLLPTCCEFEDEDTFDKLVAEVQRELSTEQWDRPNASWEDAPIVFMFANGAATANSSFALKAGVTAFTFIDDDGGILIRANIDGRVILAERMREFMAQWELFAAHVLESPKSSLLVPSLITDRGRLVIPDPTETLSIPNYGLLSELFVRVANESPKFEAIRQANRSWTYADLNHSSSEVAKLLCLRGVESITVVAVTGPRSFGIVSTVLSVFRSGGILLTIDPKLPIERQRAMIEQSGATYLVCVGDADGLASSVKEVVHVDANTGMPVDEQPQGKLSAVTLPMLRPVDAAYIFFTSGSTGTPKGVVGSHQGLAHFLDWQRTTFDIGPDDRAAQITSLSFDMVLRDIFLALTSGATLCIPAEENILDPSAIVEWMATERITVLHLVPSLLRAWIEYMPPNLSLPRLRRVFLAGEPVTDVLIKSFRAALGETALVTNFYGPTETTLIKCFHPIINIEPGIQPIGRPQPQTQVLILNRMGQLCGLNEIGQIAIRTPFRTLGYLNAPEITAQVFVPNPFRDDANDLIYLTGDSGLYRTDGLLVMRGRMDNQVKIRGMRVEPGEIEAVITACPEVSAAAVIAHDNDAGSGKYLAAYLVLRESLALGDESSPTAIVRDFLRSRLPDNMVPAKFFVLHELPLLPNGKINRKALMPTTPLFADLSDVVSVGDDAPKSSYEAELLAIWQNALGHRRIGVNDSFVELGGDSLTAISALIWMQRLGIPDHFAKGIFQGWTIRQISEMATGTGEVKHSIAITPKAKTNLLVNVMRGMLVAILVMGHWFEGLLNRLPAGLHGLQDLMLPVFSIATPGFAILFGVGLGYIHFPKYLSDPDQVKRSLRFGVWLLVGGIAIRGASDLAILVMSGSLNNSTDFFNVFYSALLYYALAILSVPIWFSILSKSKNIYWTLLGMTIVSLLTYWVLELFLLDKEQQGFLQLCRLMLVAKFNYFNMSVGALLGLSAGIYLYRCSFNGLTLENLAVRFLKVGVLLVGIGLLLLYALTGGFQGLKNESILPVWKWVFYSGVLLITASLLSVVLTSYERLIKPASTAINLISVLGQISLPVFVFHQLVLRTKALLVFAGMPEGLALTIPLIAFFILCGWMIHRLYGLYFGAIDATPVSKNSKETISA